MAEIIHSIQASFPAKSRQLRRVAVMESFRHLRVESKGCLAAESSTPQASCLPYASKTGLLAVSLFSA